MIIFYILQGWNQYHHIECYELVSDCYLTPNRAIFELHHGENKFIWWDGDDNVHFVLDQRA